MSPNFRRFAMGGAAVILVYGAAPAFAADANQIADALVAAMTASGESKVTYDSASAAGDDVSISNVKVAGDDGSSVTIPTLFITNAQARDQGGFTASAMSFDNATMLNEGNTITWGTASASDTLVPSAEEIKAKAKLRPFSSMNIANMKVSGGDLPEPLEIANVGASLDLDDGGLRCGTHRGGIPVSTGAVTILQQVLGGQLSWALEQPAVPATYEVDHLASAAMERHVDRRLRALHLLDRT